uniref:Uncharacterized protein n=1 Tax=Timema cristinae TaxID=61476 RepID=A0A7R9CR20_TIMCR|nr:unnamed protein product [Timema cristinae]
MDDLMQGKKKFQDLRRNLMIGQAEELNLNKATNLSKDIAPSDFENIKPPKAQLDAAKLFLNYSVNNGQLSSNYNLIGHKQVAKTQSPGRQLFDIIKTWEHWERCDYMC